MHCTAKLLIFAGSPPQVTESRIKENLQLDDFELTPAHMEKLAGLADGYHYCWDPTDVA